MHLDPEKRYGAWKGSDIERFLKETRIPLRLSFDSGAGVLIVPVWFEYRAERLWSCSPQESLLVKALTARPEVAFDVSTNDVPYRGVRGRGRARCSIAKDDTQMQNLLTRYVAGTENELAQWLLQRPEDEAIIQVEATWLTSWDFTKRMASIDKIADRHPDAAL